MVLLHACRFSMHKKNEVSMRKSGILIFKNKCTCADLILFKFESFIASTRSPTAIMLSLAATLPGIILDI